MTFLKRPIAWIASLILPTQKETSTEWEKVKQEGKTLREELEKLSERAKEATDSTE